MRPFFSVLVFLITVQFVNGQVGFQEVNNSGLQSLSGNEGIAIGDFNNDGWEDIYVSVPSGMNRLCKNMGDGSFQEVALSSGVAVLEQSIASTWGDINNDGFLDLYVSTVNENDHLFLNNGNETFEEITLSAGINNTTNTKAVNMADVNNDGFLDIYLSNFLSENALLINQGNNTFKNKIDESGASDDGPSMGGVFFDYDNDGDVDLYLTHDHFVPNILYQNNGEGVFLDVGKSARVNSIGYGMGVDVGDVDNDGWLDIYVTNLFQNVLFKNDGDGTFSNISESANVDDLGMGWGILFLDFDKDGLMDIYVANESDFMNPAEPNVLYKNRGNLTFEKVETNENVSNIDNSFGVACFDYNLDGNIDIAVANRDTGEHLQLFQNTERIGNWVGIKLLGVESNRNGIGAKIRAVDNLGQLHYKELTAGHGWASQNTNILTLGLGEATALESLVILWPSGLEQQIDLEELNKIYTVIESETVREGIHFDLLTSTLEAQVSIPLVKIYPNPSDGSFDVLSSSPLNQADLKIHNLDGKFMQEFKMSGLKKSIQVPALPSGVYLLSIDQDGSQSTHKIILH